MAWRDLHRGILEDFVSYCAPRFVMRIASNGAHPETKRLNDLANWHRNKGRYNAQRRARARALRAAVSETEGEGS